MTIWRSTRITLSVAVASMSIVFGLSPAALGQLEPDETLGEERSQVRTLDGTAIELIEGGATRGRNLFHSFREFNVDAGRGAYFIHLPGIENILSRVTGENRSQINGVLGVRGFENGGFIGSAANLFLINPNGIVFGPNASLDVGGSFAATTADGIQFGEQGFFSATNPETPGLLTVNPSALFFNQLNPAPIRNNSIAPAGQSPSGANVFGLRVLDGQSLLLVGGNIILDGEEFGGRLNAFGGRVELGGLSEPGAVLLNADGSLGFPVGVGRSDVSLSNGAFVDVAAGDGGSIAINARNIDISDRSLLRSGIAPELGTVDSQAGDIVLNATGEIQIGQSSFIINTVGADAIGNSGNIVITADSLFVTDGAELQTSTRGQGNAGNVIVDADSRVLFDASVVFSNVGDINFDGIAVGDGGDVQIRTGSLEVINGTQIQASTFGQGNAGNVIIDAGNQVILDNGTALSNVGGADFDSVSVGNGGDIRITTGSLSLNSSQLQTVTFGQGNAGNIIINAQDTVSFNNTDAFSIVRSGAIGNSGDIRITTGSLSLNNGSQLQALTRGRGDAGDVVVNAQGTVSFDNADAFSTVERGAIGNGGNIQITTGSLSLSNQSSLQASTFGRGDAGSVIIEAQDAVSSNDTDVLSIIYPGAIGTGGNIRITTGSLSLVDGATLATSTLGQGNAGDVMINARNMVSLEGIGSDGILSAITSSVGDIGFNVVAVGDGGDIRINTGSLFLLRGTQLSASSFGRGDAGNVIINARDTVSFDDAGAGSIVVGDFNLDTGAVREGGNIRIRTGSLSLTNGSVLGAGILGRGNAGDVIINARDRVSINRAVISSSVGDVGFNGVAIGEGGNVRIRTGSLRVTDGAQLQAFTLGRGNAGDVIINARDRVSFVGENNGIPSIASSTVGTTSSPIVAVGEGGNVRVNAGSLEVTDGAQLQTFTLGQGDAGNIIINARDTVSLDGVGDTGRSSGLFALTYIEANGQGGEITVRADSIRLTDGAVINAQTFNDFRGGDITLNADTFEATGGGQAVTTTLGSGRAGNITLNVTDRITLSGFDPNYADRSNNQFGEAVISNQGESSGLFANTAAGSFGRGGTIRITTGELEMSDRAIISAQSQGTGTAGDIRLNVSEQLQLTDSDIVTNAPRSSGGDITVNTDESSGLILLRGNSDITTNSQGNGGNITLRGSGIIAFDDSDILARSQDARGGNITLAPFFSANPALESEPPFDGNGRVDVNADGSIASGTITTPDTSLIQNSLIDLPESAIDTDNLVANSCVVRSQEQSGTFIITGAEGLPQRPGDAPLPTYSTGEVRSAEESFGEPIWQMGDPIVEPQGMYRLQDGRMVLSRECD